MSSANNDSTSTPTHADAPSGPFHNTVDALVFRQSTDAPETRAAAANITQYRDVAPIGRRFEKLVTQPPTTVVEWVPESDLPPVHVDPASSEPTARSQAMEVFLRFLVTVIPMALVAGVVVAAYAWLGFA